MSEEKKTINVPSMCDKHRSILVHKSKFKQHDPWMALEMSAQITLMQAILFEDKFHIKYGGDPMAINKVGCLACFCPHILEKIIQIAKKSKPKIEAVGNIKKFGESFKTLNS